MNVKKSTLTFRYDRSTLYADHMTTMANFNGHDIEVGIGTGGNLFMFIDDAKKLDLLLKVISSREMP